MKTLKKTMILIGMILISFFVKAQLSTNSKIIKDEYSSQYEQIFKYYAVQEWNTDYRMVVYEINTQSEALISLINSFEGENTQIVYEAIIEWSKPGFEKYNINKFKDISIFNLKSLVVLHTDWRMVQYTYNNQVKAKNSF